MLEFKYPLFFLLIIPAYLIIYLYVKNSRKNARDKLVIVILRAILFTSLIFALTVPALVIPVKGKQVIFLADRSESASGSENAIFHFVDKSSEKKAGEDEFAILSFGEKAVVEKALSADIKNYTLNPDVLKGETNIEDALMTAGSLFSGSGAGRIVLLSDGNETLGKAANAVQLLEEQNVEVDYFPIDVHEKPDMALTEFSVSENMYEGELANLDIRVQSNITGTARIRITINDENVINESIKVNQGENILRFSHLMKETGFIIYKAEITPERDHYFENNVLYAVSHVEGIPKILLVENERSSLYDIIRNSNAEVDSIFPEQLPVTLNQYLEYDAIIFHNISATVISEQQMNLAEQAVKEFGKGFIMMGGENSFGLGGYFKTPIERILPVDLEIKNKAELPSLGLVIVMDRSGSMAGEKIVWAKEAAARSVELLRDEDTLGFIAFDDRPWVIVETGPIGNKEETLDKIRTVTTGGGTEFYNSLKIAFEQLEREELERKHIILLTDGDAAAHGDYFSLIEKGKESQITLSTVAIGRDADRSLLKKLAEKGDGRFYEVMDHSSIPSILSRETVMITRTYIEDEPFYPELFPVDGWDRFFKNGMPKMNAYVATTPKPDAKIPLISKKEDPVLAEWQYGLGTAIAFTSDTTGKWSGDFVKWENWPHFINYMVSRSLPKYGQASFTARVDAEGENTIVQLKGDPDHIFHLTGSVMTDTGSLVEGNMKIIAPGEYQLILPRKTGLYFLNAVQSFQDGEKRVFQTGFSVPYSKEYSQSTTNLDLLEYLAKETGGKQISSPDEAFRKLHNPVFKKTEIAGWALLVAFFAAFFEFVMKRLGLEVLINRLSKLINRDVKKIMKKERSYEKLVKMKGGKNKISEIKSPQPNRPNTGSGQEAVRKKNFKKSSAHDNADKKWIREKTDTTAPEMNREEKMKRLLEAKKRRK